MTTPRKNPSSVFFENGQTQAVRMTEAEVDNSARSDDSWEKFPRFPTTLSAASSLPFHDDSPSRFTCWMAKQTFSLRKLYHWNGL